MTPSPRARGKRTVTLTYQDFERMCSCHNLEDSDAQAFWQMALNSQRQDEERVALTRSQIQHVLYAEFCMNRDDAAKFWDAALQILQAGDR